MKDSELWSHYHRLYLIGDNSIYFPWYIAKDFPNKSLDAENREKLLNFIKTKQGVMDWSKCEKFNMTLIRFLFPPLAGWLH
jgi:hypothetical protein